MIFFSIIIPTYNRAGYVEQAINSCLQQTFTDFEILVVDDGSTDQTTEVVSKIQSPKLKYFYKNNAERGAARNFGVQHAQGQYVFFLDSDDWLLPNHLQHAFNEINKRQFPEIFHSRYVIFYEDSGKKISAPEIKKPYFEKLIKGNFLGCIIFLDRKIALENPYNENRLLSGSEDKLLNLILVSKYRLEISNQKTMVVREHQNRSMASVNIENWANQQRIFFELLDKNTQLNQRLETHKINLIKSYYLQMIAVKLMISGIKNQAFAFFKQAATYSVFSIFNRNFLRILYYSTR